MRKIALFLILMSPFVSYSQLINGDFENIETVTIPGTNDTYEKPVNWCFDYDDPIGAELTSDSYSGNYAIKLWSWYFMQSNEQFHYGNTPYGNGVPISNRPTKLIGYYKFLNPNIQPNGTSDSAYVNILMTKFNQTLSIRDTISKTEFNLGEQNTYSAFEIEINYLSSQTPDSIQIFFRTSYFQGPSDNTSECNYLYLDDLSFDFSPLSISEQGQTKPVVYPNPANDFVHILFNQRIEKINIYSINGSILDSYVIQTIEQPISCDISKLSKGLYFLELLGTDMQIMEKVKIVKK
jgi:hypothetical protein